MKFNCVISCPISTYSGYGGRSRDLVRALVQAFPEWNVKILPQRWGNTRQSYLQDTGDTFFTPMVISSLTFKPDIWIQVTIPNEFQPVGNYNIGITAGIESTVADSSWIMGCNKMNLVIVSSEFSKVALTNSKFTIVDERTKAPTGTLALTTPLKTLFEGIDTQVYRNENVIPLEGLNSIPEKFCFLAVGHWMQGDLGHDRKNIGLTIKTFLETFKNKSNRPALILKTSQASSSAVDVEKILKKIHAIKDTVKGDLPNIYLLYGEMSDQEMNSVYNHPKVKALVSLTKGEGYGRPLAEFALTGKPVIASKWSGHLDFLKPEHSVLVGGTLEKVHKSATVDKMLLEDAEWFAPAPEEVIDALKSVYKEYNNYKVMGKRQATHIRNNFNLDRMKDTLKDILTEATKDVKAEVKLNLNLPKLKKIE